MAIVLNHSTVYSSIFFIHLTVDLATAYVVVSCVRLFVTSWTAAGRLPCPSLSPRVCSNSWVDDAIQPSHPLSSPSPPAFSFSQYQDLFQWVSSSHQVAKVLELQLQHQSFQWIFRIDFLQDCLVWSSCYPRDSQESSPEPQFKSINSLALNLLNGPILIFIHNYWKNRSFDYVDLCQQSDVSAFLLYCLGLLQLFI